MGKIEHGSIAVTVPDALDPPEKAGKMTPEEVARIPKPPRGLGLVCEKASDAIKKAGSKFTLPAGVTADGIAAAGKKADDVDLVITDLEVVTQIMKQANLIFDPTRTSRFASSTIRSRRRGSTTRSSSPSSRM